MGSEFKEFLETNKHLGIPFSINWGPTKEKWQQVILSMGYNITALACTVITVVDIEYLFCNGSVGWTDKEVAIGPAGLFLFARKSSGEVIPRTLHESNKLDENTQNLKAIMKQYPDHEWRFAEIV